MGAGPGGGSARAGGKLDKSWREVWPHAWELLKPRWGMLAYGFGLMLVNRVCGLVLPTSSKYLIDNVIGHKQVNLLLPILGIVLAATAVQGLTTYGLAQSLSKEAQRLINELRRRVQAHLARLPVSFYDKNNTGALVSRVMSDVEGVRNLLGTGLVQFAGSIVTALIALGLLWRISPAMTVVAAGFVAAFSWTIRHSFGVLRPIFRERRMLNAEVTGRLTESIAGVRVVKGYHAEERESAVFRVGQLAEAAGIEMRSMPDPRSASQLRSEMGKDRGSRNALIDLHRRYAAPVACLVLALLSIPLNLAGGRRAGYLGLLVSAVLVVVYFLTLQLGVSLARNGLLREVPLLGVWLQNLIFGALALVLLWRQRR